MNSKKQSYDRVAKVFDFLRGGDMRRWSPHQKLLFEKLQGNVLYVGTGTGLETVNFPPQSQHNCHRSQFPNARTIQNPG